MPVDLTTNYNPADFRLNSDLLIRRANQLLKLFRLKNHNLSILLVDDREISWFNQHYRGKEGSTNVLSFPFSEGADPAVTGLPFNELGDIIISLDTAYREASRDNISFFQHMTRLLVHGFLHLLGYDHEISEQEAEKMFAKEQESLQYLANFRSSQMTHLAVNVDHIATIRQARGITEPDPVAAAAICELAGAKGIVVHLREDRRHMQDRDIWLLKETVKSKLNLEMGAAKEIIKIALDLKPDMVTLVPEKRAELTTEGGLNVAGQKKKLAKTIAKMEAKGIPVSLFIDPDPKQIKASLDIGATFVEIHTGRYCDAEDETTREEEFHLIAEAAEEAFQIGLRVNAGHGLDYRTTGPVAALDTIEELSIGHAIISRAVFSGLDLAVRDMAAIIEENSRFF